MTSAVPRSKPNLAKAATYSPQISYVEDANNLSSFLNQIIHGDCLDQLRDLPNACVDLIITSPPYAQSRKKTYDGVNANDYVKWFLPISEELKRVLKPTGSFVLNIKEPAIDGQRHTFVIELILAMVQEQQWRWVEEYCWHKRNSYPGKWSNRFRNAWERCLHFTLERQFSMYQDAVMQPVGDWKAKRFSYRSSNDDSRNASKTESGLGRKVTNWENRDMAYPTNVLHFATECRNRSHSAAFPLELPTWFIKLFTQPGDVVLDPFIGSGTTALACQALNRNFIGIEKKQEYCIVAQQRCADYLNQSSIR